MTYSVIIPYRDTYNLLIKAVDSIPDREDIQIIIIDNSVVSLEPDAVPRKQYAQVLFLTSDSQAGAGHARNVGLASATGKFILFLDADDYFVPDAFNHFDQYSEEENDIVFFSARSVKLSDGSMSKRHLRLDSLVKEYFRTGNDDVLRFHYDNPCCKLFSSAFLRENKIQFEEVLCSNDTMFSLISGYKAKRISVEDYPIYTITESSSKKSLTARSKEKDFIRFTVSIRQNQFCIDVGKGQYGVRILPRIVKAFLYYGFGEGLKYIMYARDNQANIFTGYFNIS